MGTKNAAFAKETSYQPRRKLTVTHIKALKSTSDPYPVSDPECPGLLLHVPAALADGSSGAKAWQWRFYWKRKRVKLTVGQYPELSQADAHERVRQARALLERGIDPRQAGLTRERSAPSPPADSDGKPIDPHSVEALAKDFMARFIIPHRKRPEYVHRILDVEVLKHWRTRDARTILPRDVIELLDGIVDRGSRTMANRTAAILGQMFKFAIQRRYVDSSPVQLLYAPGGKEKPRDRALDDAELGALLRSLDEVFIRAPTTAIAIRIALLTACRRSELVLAEWADITLDGDAPVWRIPVENAKTEVQCFNPLVPAAVAEFRRLKARAGRSRYVMPNVKGDGPLEPRLLTRSIARHLDTLSKKHGVGAFTLHDLRRTVRTGLARLKIQPHIAERVLNHAQPGIAAAYDVYQYQDEKRAALKKWAALLTVLQTLSVKV
jgi:integrase